MGCVHAATDDQGMAAENAIAGQHYKAKAIRKRLFAHADANPEIADDVYEAFTELIRLQALVEWRTDWENAPKSAAPLLGHQWGQWYRMWWSHATSCWMSYSGTVAPTHFMLITPPESKP